MANSASGDEGIKCPVCLESYSQPRKLPRCGHTFCEECILKHVSNEREQNEGAGEYPCAVCKAPHPIPENGDRLTDWVTSLELDEDIVSKRKLCDTQTCKTNGSETCGPCKEQGKNSKGSKYCVNCHEGMCENCTHVHNALKLMKHHKVLDHLETNPINEQEIDASKNVANLLSCPFHPDKLIEFHCRDDNALVCATCVAAHHRKCNDIVELNDSISFETVEKGASKLKEEILSLITYAEEIIKAKQANVRALKDQSEGIIVKIGELRTKLIQLFEAMEETINQQTKALTKKHALVIDEEISTIKETIASLKYALTLTEKSVLDGSSNQLYIVVQNVRKNFSTYETSIIELGKQSEDFQINLKQKETLAEVVALNINETEKLAIVEETKATTILPSYTKKKLLRFNVESTDKVHIQGMYNRSHNPTYSFILYLQEGLLIIDEYRLVCSYVNEKHQIINSKYFTETPMRATHIRPGVIAVLVRQKKIYFQSCDEHMSTICETVTKYYATAICGLSNGDLAIAWNKPVAFGIVLPYADLPSQIYFTKDKANRQLQSFEYMAIDEKNQHVIQPCKESKTVYCFDFDGNPKFAYASANLKAPRGVAVDCVGCVFVCDSECSCVHVISPTGEPVQIIRDGCPPRPLAIAFNSSFDQFAITNETEDWCEINFFTLRHDLCT